MIRVQAKAPFRYQYGSKQFWFTTGESMYLNPINDSEREELKYILSNRFPFTQLVYIDLTTLDDKLKLEINQEEGFYTIEEPYFDDCPPPTPPASFTAPYEEPGDNPHLNPVIQAYLEDRPSTGSLIDEQGTINPIQEEAMACEVQEESEEALKDTSNNNDIDYESRRKELLHTSWSKVKDIAQVYGIEYSNKSETINEILDQEFPDCGD